MPTIQVTTANKFHLEKFSSVSSLGFRVIDARQRSRAGNAQDVVSWLESLGCWTLVSLRHD